MKNKNKKILATACLGLVGLGCLTGCDMTTEEMSKWETKADSVIETLSEQNKKLEDILSEQNKKLEDMLTDLKKENAQIDRQEAYGILRKALLNMRYRQINNVASLEVLESQYGLDYNKSGGVALFLPDENGFVYSIWESYYGENKNLNEVDVVRQLYKEANKSYEVEVHNSNEEFDSYNVGTNNYFKFVDDRIEVLPEFTEENILTYDVVGEDIVISIEVVVPDLDTTRQIYTVTINNGYFKELEKLVFDEDDGTFKSSTNIKYSYGEDIPAEFKNYITEKVATWDDKISKGEITL